MEFKIGQEIELYDTQALPSWNKLIILPQIVKVYLKSVPGGLYFYAYNKYGTRNFVYVEPNKVENCVRPINKQKLELF